MHYAHIDLAFITLFLVSTIVTTYCLYKMPRCDYSLSLCLLSTYQLEGCVCEGVDTMSQH